MGVLLAAGAIVDARAILRRRAADGEFQRQVDLARAEGDRIRAEVVLPRAKNMPRGENFAGALQQFGLSVTEVNDATAAAQRAYNLRQLRAGTNGADAIHRRIPEHTNDTVAVTSKTPQG